MEKEGGIHFPENVICKLWPFRISLPGPPQPSQASHRLTCFYSLEWPQRLKKLDFSPGLKCWQLGTLRQVIS